MARSLLGIIKRDIDNSHGLRYSFSHPLDVTVSTT